ncbi:unnamed protein product [Adineta steineri]|uniref:G-protein coupled receptors family 1 profile domain-containing protein n=2 Tax=Adineta steineri TaxID=433720 RepID=A0A818QH25_9BILA|nr:unnamed protein product [Adineta steineri]
MSSSTNNLITNLNTASFWINLIVPAIQITLGTVGSLFNIIIFTRRSLRSNSCSLYFLAGSINNLFVVYLTFLPRYLAANWGYDPTTTNNVWCKLSSFLKYPFLALTLWFTVLASMDRFFSSSRNIRFRQLCTLPIARKIILLIILLIFLSHGHILVLFTIVPSNIISTCNTLYPQYLIFFDIFIILFSIIIPIVLMAMFGILMILNVHKVHNRIIPQTDNTVNQRFRSNDRQLIIMLLSQVLITTIISIPYCIFSMYTAIPITILQYRLSMTDQVIYIFGFNVSRLVYYNNFLIGFFIYTLTGPIFRVECKRCIQYGFKKFLTTTGLIRCLPLRTQQALLNENRVTVNMKTTTMVKGRNNVRLLQQQQSTILKSVV